MICPIHQSEQRTVGPLTFCEGCRTGAPPALMPSNGKPAIMTVREALGILRPLAAVSEAGQAAYNTVVAEMRKRSGG